MFIEKLQNSMRKVQEDINIILKYEYCHFLLKNIKQSKIWSEKVYNFLGKIYE